ncbi:hypothetical protein J6590_060717 [Homalodisca vitripennis]|nr:hypothetical protein J6590_060717 [Homalodisca vitripennis]
MSEKKIVEYFTPRSAQRTKRQRSNSSPGSVLQIGNMNDRVEDMIHRQLMEGLSGLLDDKLSKLATKDDLANLTGNLGRKLVTHLKAQEQIILNRLINLESRSHRNNLICKGLKWAGRAHPLGRDGKTLFAHLLEDSDVDYLISQARKKLKGTGYVVQRDFPREIRQTSTRLTALRVEIERVVGKRKMPLVFDHLIVEECRLTWENGKLRAGQCGGVRKLQDLLKHDFSDFATRLGHDSSQWEEHQVSGTSPPPKLGAAVTSHTSNTK